MHNILWEDSTTPRKMTGSSLWKSSHFSEKSLKCRLVPSSCQMSFWGRWGGHEKPELRTHSPTIPLTWAYHEHLPLPYGAHRPIKMDVTWWKSNKCITNYKWWWGGAEKGTRRGNNWRNLHDIELWKRIRATTGSRGWGRCGWGKVF